MQDLYTAGLQVKIQPRKRVDHAEIVAPTGQRELDSADQGSICSERARSSSGNRLSIRRVRGTFSTLPVLLFSCHFTPWYTFGHIALVLTYDRYVLVLALACMIRTAAVPQV